MDRTADASERRTRRRGATLEHAILEATLNELATTGYAGMTMDAVAERAQTGKAALYRRWPSKREIVLDALVRLLPDPQELATTRSVRDRLLAALTVMTDALAGRSAYPGFTEMAEMLRDPQLRTAFSGRVVEPRLRLIEKILHEGSERGEVRSTLDTPLIARIGPALVIQAFLLTAEPPPPAEIARIVDTILMPLVRR